MQWMLVGMKWEDWVPVHGLGLKIGLLVDEWGGWNYIDGLLKSGGCGGPW